MPTKSRPQPKPLVIADCSSVVFPDNPTPECPHGLLWWESDGDRFTDDLQAKMCREATCKSTEHHPHAGESISIRDYRTLGGRKPLRAVWSESLAIGNGGTIPDGYEDRLRELVQDLVVDWTWTGVDGEPLPLPKDDWEAVESQAEYAEILWIVEAAYRGKDPREALYRPLALPNGKDSPHG